MRRGFTLLELLVVLVVISVLLSLLFPILLKSGLGSEESLKSKISTLFSSAFVPGESVELCIDFKGNRLEVGEEEVELRWKVESLVVPGKLVSSELYNRYCLDLKRLTYGAIIMENGGSFPSLLFTFPSGETVFYNLQESEVSTLKDKVEKGRVVDWFSYYQSR